ncbi:MAG: hypothetical protein IJV50_09885 [Lachnospiraceae bacterium]|nr:hypothetical protein [Lachnospiraceae bacterium]
MKKNKKANLKPTNTYDDDNIPETDLPRDCGSNASDCSSSNCSNCDYSNAEPLPESSRPRKDGPGGEGESEE